MTEIKILFYPEIHTNTGTGNLIRMAALYKYFKEKRVHDISFAANKSATATRILKPINEDIHVSQIDDKEYYDAVLYDSSVIRMDILSYLKSKTSKLVAFDFFDYQCKFVDVIINLYVHNRKNASDYKGDLYEGIQYFILRDAIQGEQNMPVLVNQKPKILITFGGEDPNSNTLKVLKEMNDRNSARVIIGSLNKDQAQIRNICKTRPLIEVLEPTPCIGKIMRQSDIIICGGGTTLMEAIFIGNPVIGVPQNKREDDFIYSLKQDIPIYGIKDLSELINKTGHYEFRRDILKQYHFFIDGKGKERILKIVAGGYR